MINNQKNYDLIPGGTLAKVKMIIKPGGYDDSIQGWTGGYATKNPATGAIYLSCEFVILKGKYANRSIWSLIELYSPESSDFTDIGNNFIEAILNSARGIYENDISKKAQNARRINNLKDLDGIEFVAEISVINDRANNLKNEILFVITPNHKNYARLMDNRQSINNNHP